MKHLLIKISNIFAGVLLIITSVFAASPPNVSADNVPLIPRSVLFSNPDKTAATISPDGSMIAYLSPVKNVLNIWVEKSNDLSSAHPVTNETVRNIRDFDWTYNNNLLYVQDKNGDEDFHLYKVDLKTGLTTDLTPFPKTKVEIIKLSPEFPNEILIGLNKRKPEWHDVYKLNLLTGELTLLEENNEFGSFVADEKLNLRLAEKPNAENSPDYYIKDQNGKWKLFEHIPFDDALTTSLVALNKSGSSAYMLDSKGRDKAALISVDLSNHVKTVLGESKKSDISAALFHPTELTLQAFASEYEKIDWTIVDDRIKSDFAYLKKAFREDFSIESRSLTDDKWIVRYYSDLNPSRFYLYERDPKTSTPIRLTFLFVSSKKFENQPFSPMKPLVIKSRDGFNLVSYLTLPRTVALNAKGMPTTPLPMVLFVHGGPWARDSWGLNRYHQWFANRGLAVLSVNYRGSVGFGKKFVNAGNMEWGRKMHQDIIDAVNWTIEHKIADPKKIAIVGGSYGGYETLVGLTFTPKVFCCGVSIVGPSNLYTLIQTIPPYWKPDIALFKKRVGNIDTIAGRNFLKSRSPLTFVSRIIKPLLILQGENDPRVKKSEAEQIVNSMKAKNIPVIYVLFHDEGHGFVRQENQLASNAFIEEFLAKNLGNRFEPIGNDFVGSNFSVEEGLNLINDLASKLGDKKTQKQP